MTPHLHPRSRLTTSLFGTTLLVSFLVVGMPHIIPCPAPRVKYTEGDFEIMEDGRRRRRRRPAAIVEETSRDEAEVSLPARTMEGLEEEVLGKRNSHECPIPKPSGLIGEVLGFKKEGQEAKLPRPRIETRIPQKQKENS